MYELWQQKKALFCCFIWSRLPLWLPLRLLCKISLVEMVPGRLIAVHLFCTSQIWWTKISWISSRSGSTGRCISCYHPTCWWLTPLLLTSLTVSIPLSGLSAHTVSGSSCWNTAEVERLKPVDWLHFGRSKCCGQNSCRWCNSPLKISSKVMLDQESSFFVWSTKTTLDCCFLSCRIFVTKTVWTETEIQKLVELRSAGYWIAD